MEAKVEVAILKNAPSHCGDVIVRLAPSGCHKNIIDMFPFSGIVSSED